MNNLTKIAALPGSGAGCMSAMKAEEAPAKPELVYPGVRRWLTYDEVRDRYALNVQDAKPKFEPITVWPTLEAFKATVQMKAPYFDHSKDWTPVYYKADHDELAFPPIDLGPGI